MLATADPGQKLRDTDVLIEEFVAKVTADIERVRDQPFDPAYGERFRQTALRLSKQLNEQLAQELDATALAEVRGIMVDAIHDLEEIDAEKPWDAVEVFVLKSEAIRHIVRDALDGHAGSDGRDAQALAETLASWLPRILQRELADLVGISPRQFLRWKKEGGDPSRRLLLVVRLVALLHRAWTPEGVVAWFGRERRDLGDKRPIDVLDDHDYEQRLLAVARQGRAQHGS